MASRRSEKKRSDPEIHYDFYGKGIRVSGEYTDLKDKLEDLGGKESKNLGGKPGFIFRGSDKDKLLPKFKKLGITPSEVLHVEAGQTIKISWIIPKLKEDDRLKLTVKTKKGDRIYNYIVYQVHQPWDIDLIDEKDRGKKDDLDLVTIGIWNGKFQIPNYDYDHEFEVVKREKASSTRKTKPPKPDEDSSGSESEND